MKVFVAVGLFALAGCNSAAPDGARANGGHHQYIDIHIADSIVDPATGDPIKGPFSGRIIVHAAPFDPALDAPPVGDPRRNGENSKAQADAFMKLIGDFRGPSAAASIAAMDVTGVRPGDTVRFDADLIAQPRGFSSLSPGDYAVQAVFDLDRDYAFAGTDAGDLMSSAISGTSVAKMTLPSAAPRIEMSRVSAPIAGYTGKNYPILQPLTREVRFHSNLLSAFHSKNTDMRAWVILPPGYETSGETYPVVYWFGAYSITMDSVIPLMDAGYPMAGRPIRGTTTPPMIWVLLDHSGPTGMHEFADSANNGPVGKALTQELMPWLEAQYRIDPNARYLTGHSSGGWAALWVQVTYPKMFAGAWALAPDPVDFREFNNTDIYAPGANMFYAADGTEKPLVRGGGEPNPATVKQFSDFERVSGPMGGQMASFEWVFSPRGPDGKPKPLYDRKAGKIDPAVARYWREHYDIAERIRRDWAKLKPDLDGKLHIITGTADTYYLERAARLLKETLDRLGAVSDIRFAEGRTHHNLGMEQEVALEIYKAARPDTQWRPRVDPRSDGRPKDVVVPTFEPAP